MTNDFDPPTPADAEERDRFLVLVVRYFDGDLSEAETADLNSILRTDPECRRQFAEYSIRGRLIRETFSPERQGATFLPPARMAGRRRMFLVAGVVGLIAVAATVAFVFLTPSPRTVGAPVVGAVEPASGDSRILTPDGEVRVVRARAEVRSGDTVRTEGPQGAAAVVYADGTRIALVGDTAVTCSGEVRKTVVVHQGTVGVSVSPQPEGSPMVLATPAARIEVHGTEFYCQALPDRTDVSVTRGSVRVVRASDGRAVDVSAGKRVLAERRTELAVEDILQPPDTLDLDFENGLPEGFQKGRFVTDGLPRGSKGGVVAVRSDLGEDGIFYEIASPDLWYRGLFAVHADTHVHFTFKMERPNWFNVFVQARRREPKGSFTGNYLFNELRLPRRGQWRTASIPLSKFGRAGAGDPSATLTSDEVPFRVFFSSQGDRGLVIDRIWVTRGGPGVVRYEDVE